MVAKIGLMFMRFALSFWVGAAVLFVVTGVIEVTTPNLFLTSPVKDVLVTIRFPPYYIVGWSSLGTALLFGLFALTSSAFSRKRIIFALLLTTMALITMMVDYCHVYTPLAKMVTPPGKARDMNFEKYHKRSMYINTFDVSLCFLAAIITCYPFKEKEIVES